MPDARPRRDEHVALGGRSRTRILRARPGRRAPAPARLEVDDVRHRARRALSYRAPFASCAERPGDVQYDVIHAHFGLSAWPALALRGAPHAVTLHGTDVRHPPHGPPDPRGAPPRWTSSATVSAALGRRAGSTRRPARREPVLPCGVGHRPLPADAAGPMPAPHLGLDPDGPRALPGRPVPCRRSATTARVEVAGARPSRARGVDPAEVPRWSTPPAPCLPSAAEGFGLAVLEALACDVPVLATPVGIHPSRSTGSPAPSARPSTPPPGGPPSRRTSGTTIRASRAGRGRPCRADRWPAEVGPRRGVS